MGEVFHIVPRDDVIQHETDSMDGCACQPLIEQVDGGWIIIHAAWDGRTQ